MFNSINLNSNIASNKNINAKFKQPSFGMAYREQGMDDIVDDLSQGEYDRYMSTIKHLDRTSNRYGFDIDLIGDGSGDRAIFSFNTIKDPEKNKPEIVAVTKQQIRDTFPELSRVFDASMKSKKQVIDAGLRLQREKNRLLKQIARIGR